ESADWFDRARLLQARVVPNVLDVAALDFGRGRWRDPENRNLGSSCMVLGYDLNPAFVPEAHRGSLPLLTTQDAVMLDRFSHPDYGAQRIGKEATLQFHPVRIAALFDMGVGFQAEGTIVTSIDTFMSLLH